MVELFRILSSVTTSRRTNGEWSAVFLLLNMASNASSLLSIAHSYKNFETLDRHLWILCDRIFKAQSQHTYFQGRVYIIIPPPNPFPLLISFDDLSAKTTILIILPYVSSFGISITK